MKKLFVLSIVFMFLFMALNGIFISLYGAIGAAIASADLPVLHVQEGGYLQPELGDNLTSYLNGAEGQV